MSPVAMPAGLSGSKSLCTLVPASLTVRDRGEGWAAGARDTREGSGVTTAIVAGGGIGAGMTLLLFCPRLKNPSRAFTTARALPSPMAIWAYSSVIDAINVSSSGRVCSEHASTRVSPVSFPQLFTSDESRQRRAYLHGGEDIRPLLPVLALPVHFVQDEPVPLQTGTARAAY
jgi:hypothetical protein